MRSRLARAFAFAGRHRLAVALAVAVLLRAALPYAVRPLLERQASATLNADVRIGDVDLALYRAGIALDDVAIRPAGWTPEADTGEPPLVAWKRFGVAVRWLPLFRKTIQLRELLLDSPRIAVDRLQDGGLNVMALVPKSDPAAEEPAEGGSAWSVGIDRFVLRDGGVRFRDLMFARLEPVELSLGSFEADEIALSPSVYGGPAQVRLEGRVDDGRFVLDASLAPRDGGGFALASHLKARRLPLRRTRVYVPKVGWSELEGEFGGALDYALESGGRNDVRGRVTIDGLKVHTAQLEGPGLAWKRLAVLVDPIDLAGRDAVVRFVELDGSYLVARARGGVVFPFIEAVLTGEPVDEPAGGFAPPALAPDGFEEPAPWTVELAPVPIPPMAPAPTPAAIAPAVEPPPAPAAPATAPAPPWTWRVDRVDVWNSLMHVISPDASFDAGCTLAVRGLRSEAGDPATISLALGIGDAGTIALDGKTQIQPLGFAGGLRASQVPLPDVVATFGVLPPGVLQRARLDVDVGVALGTLAPAPGDVRLNGLVALDEPYLAGAAGPSSEIGAARVAVTLDELLVPGGLAVEPPAVAADARIAGARLSLDKPWAVRTEGAPFDVHAGAFEAVIEELTAPGVGPAPGDGGTLRLRGRVTTSELAVADAGGSGLDVGLRGFEVGLGEVVLPGIRAADPAAVRAPLKLARGAITLTQPRAAGRGPRRLDTGAQRVALTVGELSVPGVLRGAPGDVQVRNARLDLDDPRVADGRGGPLDVRAGGLDLAIADLLVPGGGAPRPIRLRGGSLALADPRVADHRGAHLNVRARAIDVTVGDLQAPLGGGVTGTQLRGGRLVLAEPAVVGADPRELAIAARAIAVGADDVALPAAGPAQVRLRELTLASPRVQVTRTPAGLVLPGAGPDAPPPAAPVKTAAVEAPAPAPAAAPAFDLTIASLRLTDGRIGVTDRSVKPPYTGVVAPLAVDMTGVRWPAMQVDRLRIDATTADRGTVTIAGRLAAGGGTLDVTTRDIALKPFSPYATSLSPYSIKRGKLSVTTKATFAPGKYDSKSTVVLHDFDLGSRAGDSLFKEQFGIPLSMALALLRDLNGDIKLDIPVAGDEQGMRVGYTTIIAGALRSALVGALTSPLKLVGAVFSGDKVQAAPAPISFRTGQAVLTGDGEKQVGQLGTFLTQRPAMAVALQTAPITTDARALQEHDLLEELGAPQGVFRRLRNLTRRGVRDRITQALAARAEDKPGELSAEDQKTLDEWLAERPAPTPQRVAELARARLAAVETALRDKHGVAANRIVRRDPPAEPADASPPTVDIELGSVADLTAPPADDAAVVTR